MSDYFCDKCRHDSTRHGSQGCTERVSIYEKCKTCGKKHVEVKKVQCDCKLTRECMPTNSFYHDCIGF